MPTQLTAAIMHARWAAMRPFADQNSPSQQKHRAGAVQSGVQGREVRVLFGDQAAGLIREDRVRRFAINNAKPNMTSENRSSVAIAEGSGNVASAPG